MNERLFIVATALLMAGCGDALPPMSLRQPQTERATVAPTRTPILWTITPTVALMTPVPVISATPTIQTQTASYFVTPIPAVEAANGD